MDNFKNKIITISGEPASGKSTVVKALTESYENAGYNVHIISVGKLFREFSIQEYSKMYPDKKDINLSDFQSDELFKSKVNKIDKLVDNKIENLGKEINSKERPDDVYIVDSRLAWKNIPNSFSVRLTVDDTIAGKRVFNDKSRGNEDSYTTLSQAIFKTKERKSAEIKRYLDKYNVDLTNPDNYNLIIDTAFVNVKDIANTIIQGEDAISNSKYYPKTWASPAYFIPLQGMRDTCSESSAGYKIEDLAKNIKENGYNPDIGTLDIVEKNGIKYLLNGNHRTFGALAAGITIVPYEVLDKDGKLANEKVDTYTIEKNLSEYLYDYVDIIRYYGGRNEFGNINFFKDFNAKDLIHYKKVIKEIDKIKGKDEK